MKGVFTKINERGNILILILAFGWISMIVVLGLISYAITENRASKYKMNREEAVQVAEAGIAYYRWHLAHNNTDYQDGTGAPGPYVHEYRNKNGDLVGYYSLTIIPPENGSTIVTVFSTGWLVDQPDSKRTIKVRVGFPAISDYAFLVDGDLIFSNTAFVHGKTHANGAITFDGVSDAPLSSALNINGTGGPRSYWLYPVPRKDFAAVQVSLADIKTRTQANGLVWPYLAPSGVYGYQLEFRNDGTVDVSKVVTAPACHSSFCYDIDNTNLVAVGNYPIPTSSYIFIDSSGGGENLWVKGTINGRATVATVGDDIILNGNITYLAKNGLHTLGLMTDSNIIFPYDVPDPMEVDAALVAVNGTIFRPKYITPGDAKNIVNTLNFYGSRISAYSGGLKYLGCGSVCSGFSTTNYTYDASLTYSPPAGFPVGSTYNLISWEEVRSTSTAAFVAVSSVTISPTTVSIAANTTYQFTASVLPAEATVKNVTWSVLGGDESGTITANGLYTAPVTASGPSGYTVIASAGGVVAVATVYVTSSGNQPPYVVNSPVGDPSTVVGTATLLKTLWNDDGSESNLRYNWTMASGPSTVTFGPSNNTNGGKNTTVTFNRVGTYTFTVTVTDQNGNSRTATTPAVIVNQTLSYVDTSPAYRAIGSDETQQFTATSSDQFHQPMTTGGITFNWSTDNGSITTDGLYTPASIGPGKVFAVTGGVTGSSTVAVTAPVAPPSTGANVPSVRANATSVTTGYYNVGSSELVLAFLAANTNANRASFSLSNTAITGGSLTWTRVGTIANSSNGAVAIYRGVPSGNLTNVRTRFTASGSGTSQTYLKILILDGASSALGTFNKANSNSGHPVLTVNASSGKSQVYTIGYDATFTSGATTFDQSLVDECKSTTCFSSNGDAFVQKLTTATAGAGDVTFNRLTPNGVWNMAGVEVKNNGAGAMPPTIVSDTAVSPTTVTGVTTSLSVLGDDDAGEGNLTYSWNYTGPSAPSFLVASNTNAGKNNTAIFNRAGSYQFRAVIRDQNNNWINSSWVSVVVKQTTSSVTVSPNDVTLQAGGAPQQFSATSSDQFGNPMLVNPFFVWSTNNGTIDGTGFYHQPGSIGFATVYAVSSGVTGTAAVTVSSTAVIGGSNCTSGACVAVCGDSIVEPGEDCDDGNTVAGDGCSASCLWENIPGMYCSNASSSLPQTISIPVIYRDFKGYDESAPNHPDFERYGCGGISHNLVSSTLVNGKPIFAHSSDYNPPSQPNGCGQQLTSAEMFSVWYTNSSTWNKSINSTLVLTQTGSAPPTYTYDSSITPLGNLGSSWGDGFYPLDYYTFPDVWGLNHGNHNFAFTSELHYWFTYQGGETLYFSGDDDVWVFINGRLALDIGGLHPEMNGTLTLNTTKAAQLGLVVGGAYDVALFHAERHTTASNFKLTIGGFVKKSTTCSTVCGDAVPAGNEQCDDGDSLHNNGIVGNENPDGTCSPGLVCNCTYDCQTKGPVN